MRKPRDQKSIKIHNYNLVMEILKEGRSTAVSRADIAKMTGMSPTTVTRIVSVLIGLGLVKDTAPYSEGVGRKGILLDIVEDAFYSLGISIDSDFVNLCITRFNDSILDEVCIPLENRMYTPEEILQMVIEQAGGMAARQNCRDRLTQVGVSCAGNVNYLTGEVVFAPQLGWEHVDLAGMVGERLKLPVYADNDTKMSLIGAGRRNNILREEDVVYLTVGTGVGSAVMFGGKLIRGVNNAAGEIGHSTFDPGGRLCDCGRFGCLQTYLTENEILKQARELLPELAGFGHLMELYGQGDEKAGQVIDRLCDYIAITLNNLAYTYNPKYLLVAGKLIFNFPQLFDWSADRVKPLMHESLYENLVIRRVTDRDNAAYGASLVAQTHHVEHLLKTSAMI